MKKKKTMQPAHSQATCETCGSADAAIALEIHKTHYTTSLDAYVKIEMCGDCLEKLRSAISPLRVLITTGLDTK